MTKNARCSKSGLLQSQCLTLAETTQKPKHIRQPHYTDIDERTTLNPAIELSYFTFNIQNEPNKCQEGSSTQEQIKRQDKY